MLQNVPIQTIHPVSINVIAQNKIAKKNRTDDKKYTSPLVDPSTLITVIIPGSVNELNRNFGFEEE